MNGKEENIKTMSSVHSEILDELYFIATYEDILKELNLSDSTLRVELWQMIENGLVKVMSNYDEEIELNKEGFEQNLKKYHYIASKKGLMWHNSL